MRRNRDRDFLGLLVDSWSKAQVVPQEKTWLASPLDRVTAAFHGRETVSLSR